MRIIAQSDNWYVIQITEGKGRVFDAGRRRLFAPMSLVSILARGGWSKFSGDEAPVLAALNEAQDLAPEHANQETLGRPVMVEEPVQRRQETTGAAFPRLRVASPGRRSPA
jgi:hypothetical protein